MEFLIYWLFFEFIGRSIARFVIPALSFGRAYVHPLNASPEHFNWLGYRRDQDRRIVVARDVAGFIFRIPDYYDAWQLYNSDPACWERYYNPPPTAPEAKDTLVRDSAAQAGIPSRRNVFELPRARSQVAVRERQPT
ncbi:hypothetical protein [Bradyrhizobium sp. 21]|uniref:hypothetical protein n=1 Tax=Bradyrhizobium sp. 21 TaxID=2782666 RepID=UPI001FFB585C|nr:hypothetical protein [Bradyrhizobium sp. 21]MCK1387355.1 hypothetical protein [Bradyrhizobium sp. 21]